MKPTESRKTDRTLVIVAALIGLGLGGWVILKAKNFGSIFKPPSAGSAAKGKELLDEARATVKATQDATTKVKAPSADPIWVRVNSAGMDRGFLASTRLVFRRGATPEADSLVDLNKEDPRLRDKFPNAWLLKYNLPLDVPNVDELDQDEDCFTNFEEYDMSVKLAKEFSPIDKESHPPLHFRLKYVNFEEENYELRFKPGPWPNLFFGHENKANKNENWSEMITPEDLNNNGTLDPDENGGDNGKLDPPEFGKKNDNKRFRVDSYKTQQQNVDGVNKDVGIVTIEDLRSPKADPRHLFQMTEDSVASLPQSKATFEYSLTPGKTYDYRRYEKFTLPNDTTTYLLVVADKEKAVLEFEENGKKMYLTIPMGQTADPSGLADKAP